MKRIRENYFAPECEELLLVQQGVLCQSGDIQNYTIDDQTTYFD